MDSLKDSGLAVLFEDEDIFILNKPAGLHSVANQAGGAAVADQLLKSLPALEAAAERPGDAGLVNRLDQMTSGILLGAKNRNAWLSLREVIQQGGIEKSYVALVEGRLEGAREINNFIGTPHRHGRKVRVYQKQPARRERALPARTAISPMKILPQWGLTLVRVLIHTARRHQLRAHCASIGHPLCGDRLYGSTLDLRSVLGKEGLPDFFLHAEHAAFVHPVTGQRLVINAPVPESIQDLIKQEEVPGNS